MISCGNVMKSKFQPKKKQQILNIEIIFTVGSCDLKLLPNFFFFFLLKIYAVSNIVMGSLTLFKPMFLLYRNQLVGFYQQNV